MAVYERTYDQFRGRLTPEWSRFLIIPRHAYGDVFRSKLFTGLFALCFLYPLIAAILIYLHHNVNAIAIMKIDVRELLPINGSFFETYLQVQGPIAFFINLLIGPPLVSRDLSNNALPLYLCRPFSRAEYVLGKMSVVLILLSAITWIPGLLLFAFQAYLEGGGWLVHNLWIASGIFLGSWIWILVLALLSQAVSAWVKWRVAASAALLGLFFIPSIFGEIINAIFMTRVGHLISIRALIANVWSGLFGSFQQQTGHVEGFYNGHEFVNVRLYEPPLWCSWLALLALCALCLWLLSRKVRAYEVVK
ncbi:MAG: type transport system permease protein [Blastocatellia bacterium]|jgi:ABC-2 type transport system permease protein|nr:type transport system permease protein [Blastocatellia bacterium]